MTIDEGMQAFADHIRAAQSEGTARTYATGVSHLRAYLLEQGLPAESTPVDRLDLPIATGFVTWLYEYLLVETADGDPEQISQPTKATYLAAISRFFEYLIVESQALAMSLDDYDKLRKAIARASKVHARQQLPPDKLPSHQIVEALLAEVRMPPPLPEGTPPGEQRRRQLAHLRDVAIIESLLSSGMRVSELVRLRRGNLLHDDRGALLKHTKGNREREILFSDAAWEAIWAYLAERQDGAQVRALADLPVFSRHDRRAGAKPLPLSTRSVENILLDLAARAGILERFHLTPHTLRHFFATEFLSQTGNLALTQYALGHASPNTTRIYAQTKREDFRRAHRQVFGE